MTCTLMIPFAWRASLKLPRARYESHHTMIDFLPAIVPSVDHMQLVAIVADVGQCQRNSYFAPIVSTDGSTRPRRIVTAEGRFWREIGTKAELESLIQKHFNDEAVNAVSCGAQNPFSLPVRSIYVADEDGDQAHMFGLVQATVHHQHHATTRRALEEKYGTLRDYSERDFTVASARLRERVQSLRAFGEVIYQACPEPRWSIAAVADADRTLTLELGITPAFRLLRTEYGFDGLAYAASEVHPHSFRYDAHFNILDENAARSSLLHLARLSGTPYRMVGRSRVLETSPFRSDPSCDNFFILGINFLRLRPILYRLSRETVMLWTQLRQALRAEVMDPTASIEILRPLVDALIKEFDIDIEQPMDPTRPLMAPSLDPGGCPVKLSALTLGTRALIPEAQVRDLLMWAHVVLARAKPKTPVNLLENRDISDQEVLVQSL
jgi:hypothetical protein